MLVSMWPSLKKPVELNNTPKVNATLDERVGSVNNEQHIQTSHLIKTIEKNERTIVIFIGETNKIQLSFIVDNDTNIARVFSKNF